MINLYNNHQNRVLKFKIDITGVDPSEVNPRLIIESDDKNYMVKGKIVGTECNFDIPIVEEFNQGQVGRIYYEVIVSEEQYSKLWEENFETVSKTEIKLLESNYEEDEAPKVTPKISLTSVSEAEPEKVVEKVEEKEEKVVEKVEPIVEVETKKEEKVVEEVNTEDLEETEEVSEKNEDEDIIYKEDEKVEEELFSFDTFLQNKNKED